MNWATGQFSPTELRHDKNAAQEQRATVAQFMLKYLAAECIIEAVHVIEQGDPELTPNSAEDATHFSMPTKDDVKKFRAAGHRFF